MRVLYIAVQIEDNDSIPAHLQKMGDVIPEILSTFSHIENGAGMEDGIDFHFEIRDDEEMAHLSNLTLNVP